VSSIYQMASRGGPALGDANVGWIASLLGPVSALSVAAVVPIAVALTNAVVGRVVPNYEVPTEAVVDEPPTGDVGHTGVHPVDARGVSEERNAPEAP
jgi:hypothetical protein